MAADEGRVEVVTEVAFQYRVSDSGCGRITGADGWQDGTDAAWSEPIFACGGKGLGKGGAPYADARKSAATDGLTRAAWMIGGGQGLSGPGPPAAASIQAGAVPAVVYDPSAIFRRRRSTSTGSGSGRWAASSSSTRAVARSASDSAPRATQVS